MIKSLPGKSTLLFSGAVAHFIAKNLGCQRDGCAFHVHRYKTLRLPDRTPGSLPFAPGKAASTIVRIIPLYTRFILETCCLAIDLVVLYDAQGIYPEIPLAELLASNHSISCWRRDICVRVVQSWTGQPWSSRDIEPQLVDTSTRIAQSYVSGRRRCFGDSAPLNANNAKLEGRRETVPKRGTSNSSVGSPGNRWCNVVEPQQIFRTKLQKSQDGEYCQEYASPANSSDLKSNILGRSRASQCEHRVASDSKFRTQKFETWKF